LKIQLKHRESIVNKEEVCQVRILDSKTKEEKEIFWIFEREDGRIEISLPYAKQTEIT